MTESSVPGVMFSHRNHSLLLILFLFLITSGRGHDEECGSYDNYSPPIRFPFQLVKGMKDRWSYSGFSLYRTDENQIMLEFPTILGPLKFLVMSISYSHQEIIFSDPENCLPEKLPILYNSSIHPFQFGSIFYEIQTYGISFFNCSSLGHPHLRNEYQSYPGSQDMISCPIYAAGSYDSVLKLDLVSCTKMFDFASSVDASELQDNRVTLSWSEPNCTICEAEGKKCKWKNSTEGVIECVDCKGKRKQIHIPKSFIFATSGSILLGLVLIGIFHVYGYFRKKKEDNIRVEKFLEDYRAQKPTRFSYADIKRITSGFKENLGEGAHGAVFKGKLSNEILVAVKILNNVEGEGKEFINEVGIMGKIHHINVVRLLGFCAEGVHRVLVYNFFPNGSLQNFISSPDNTHGFLDWEKLQQIALGIAKGIEYLHQGCNHPILHFDINPHNVLLDDNFTPKISDFGLAKLCSKNFSAVSLTAARGTLGYIAPEVFSRNFGNVSYKSDIYSYGMLLLEMVGGRKNIDMSSGQTFQVLYPEWIHNLLEGGDIHIHIEDEGDNKIVKKLAIVGLWCIQWQPVNRPSIKTVVQMLETGEENLLKVPPNPFGSSASTGTSEINLARRPLELEVIQE